MGGCKCTRARTLGEWAAAALQPYGITTKTQPTLAAGAAAVSARETKLPRNEPCTYHSASGDKRTTQCPSNQDLPAQAAQGGPPASMPLGSKDASL